MGQQILIPLITTEPEVTSEYLLGMLFRDVLAERTTTIAGTSNRLNNIKLASAAINGKLLNPGDVFSFNDTVGRRTEAKGYLEAGAYSTSGTVQEVGGGICQVSSTIYDCVLRSDLAVVERREHSYTVSYLPFGNDATINWGTIDFKFRNSTDWPIRMELEVDGRNLNVKLIGTKLDDSYIKTEYVELSRTPFEVTYKEDETVEPGKTVVDVEGFTGRIVETFKLYYDGEGNLLSRVSIGKSTYRALNRMILVPLGSVDADGNPTASPPPTETPTPPPTDSPTPPPTNTPTPPPTDSPTPPPTDSPPPPPTDTPTPPDPTSTSGWQEPDY
jgi:hypothetical protein